MKSKRTLNGVKFFSRQFLIKSLIFSCLAFISFELSAQNCTVNAGIDKTVCAGSSEIQEGNIGGNFVANTVSWSQVSGPGTATITNSTSLSPTFSNLVAGTYVFQIQATCQIGGLATDICTYTVRPGATPVNHAPIVINCYSPGTPINLSGVAPPGHTLSWRFTSSTGPTSGSFNGTGNTSFTGDNPTIRFSAPPLDWCTNGSNLYNQATITIRSTNNSSNCAVETTFNIFFVFNPISIAASASVPNLCDPGEKITLTGSCPGAGTGTWSLVSAPVGAPTVTYSPSINSPKVDLSNLIVGNYTFRWTVTGSACTTGSADVNFSVSSGGSSITGASVESKRFCAGTLPSTIALEGNLVAAGETVSWTQVGGSPVTITNSTSVYAQAIGLTEAGAPYLFAYTISGGGSCTKSDTMMVSVLKPLVNYGGLSGACSYSDQSVSGGRHSLIPFMHGDVIPVSVIYESGPANNIQLQFDAQMIDLNGNPTSTHHYSGTQTVNPGGTASHTFNGNTFWPNYNQMSAEISFRFTTYNNLPSCSNLIPGIYRFRVQTQDQCGIITSDIIEIRQSSVGLFNAGSDQMLPCGNTTTTLAGNSLRCEVNPFWTTIRKPALAPDPINAGNRFATNAPLIGLQNGTYMFTWNSSTSGWGCTVNSDTVRVNVSVVPPTVPAITGGGAVCTLLPVTISGELNDDAASGTWTVTTNPIGGSYTLSPSANSPTIVFTPGTLNTIYTLTWTVVNGCGSAAANTTVTTGSSSGVVADILNTNDCGAFTGSTIGTLSATPAGGVWTSSNPNYTLVSPNSATTAVSPSNFNLSLGNVTFYYTVTTACGSSVDSVSYFNPYQAVSPVSSNFCEVTSFPTTQTIQMQYLVPYGIYEIVSVTGPGTASFATAVFIPTASTHNLSFTASQSGQYVVVLRYRAGSCAYQNTSFTVQLSSASQLAIAGPDIQLCGTTNFATLNALPNPLGSSAGLWTIQNVYSGFPPSFSDARSPVSTVSFAGGAGDVLLKWSVTGDNPTCFGGSADYLRISYVPTANAGQDDFTCYDASSSPASVSLNANNPGGATGAWSIVSQPGGSTASFISPNLPNTSIVGMINGVYTLRWTVTGPGGTSCTPTTDDVTVSVYFGCALLPLELTSFTAVKTNSDATIKWQFEADEEKSMFVLERATSVQGPFTSLKSFESYSKAGNYMFVDKNIDQLNAKYVYYRLKMVSASHKVGYSKIVPVLLKKEGGIDVYPTVVDRGNYVNVGLTKNSGTAFTINMVSASGQLVRKQTVSNSSSVRIPTSGMTAGSYIIQVQDGNNTYPFKVIIK